MRCGDLWLCLTYALGAFSAHVANVHCKCSSLTAQGEHGQIPFVNGCTWIHLVALDDHLSEAGGDGGEHFQD